MEHHVFLSPHFDDAIFSCGGTIAQLVRAGRRVTILTVMGGSLPDVVPDTPIVRELHARWQAGENPIPTRQREDASAAQQLGAEIVQLGIPDCVYRMANGQALYPDEASLWGRVHPLDRLEAYADLSEAANHAMQADYLYAPLGVGNHVDHQIVRRWGVELAAQKPSIVLQFYTDFPYMKDSSKINSALLEVGTTVQPRWVFLNPQDLTLKMDAMACYASQISTFWQNTDHMRQDVELSFRVQKDLWGERYWARVGLTPSDTTTQERANG